MKTIENTLLFLNDPLNFFETISTLLPEFNLIPSAEIINWKKKHLMNKRIIIDPILAICFSENQIHSRVLCLSKSLTEKGIEILGILQPEHQIKLNIPSKGLKLQVHRLTDGEKSQLLINRLIKVIKKTLHLEITRKDKTVFFSYSKSDSKDITNNLYNTLTDKGFIPFLDKRDIKEGDLWQSELEERLSRVNSLVYIESANSGKSKWVNFEIEIAKSLSIPIFILRITDSQVKKRIKLIENVPPDYETKNNRASTEIINNIEKDLISLISQYLFQQRRIKSGLFELPHHECIEIHLSKPNIRENYLHFTDETGKSKILSKWIHPTLYPEDLEYFSKRIKSLKTYLPDFNCPVLLYSFFPPLKNKYGVAKRKLLENFKNQQGVALYHIDTVDRMSCANVIHGKNYSNLPSFKSILDGKRVFLSGSFNKIISGTTEAFDHNEASFLFREIAQLILTNSGKIIFGGHPAVSRIVYLIASRLKEQILENIFLFQSRYFETMIPDFLKEEIDWYNKIIWTEKMETMEKSLSFLRNQMLSQPIDVAFFIAGGKGIQEESKLVKEYHPNVFRIFMAGAGGYTSKLAFEENAIVIDELSDEEINTELIEKKRDFQFKRLDKEKFRKLLFSGFQ